MTSLTGFVHRRADANGVSLHYVIGGDGPLLVLLHGWPQTWFQWRLIMPTLAKHYTVLAVDLRGSGDSAKEPEPFDKLSLAADIAALVRSLGHNRCAVAGHDIGGMVTYALAATEPDLVTAACIMDVPLPGVGAWDAILSDPRSWHFRFHCQPIAEALVGGRERIYLRTFMNDIAYSPAAITEDALDEYVRCMSAPGALRSGFGYYKAFAQDALDLPQLARTRLEIPLLCLGGERSAGPWLTALYEGLAVDLRSEVIPYAGHWVAEENPDAVAGHLTEFLSGSHPAAAGAASNPSTASARPTERT